MNITVGELHNHLCWRIIEIYSRSEDDYIYDGYKWNIPEELFNLPVQAIDASENTSSAVCLIVD